METGHGFRTLHSTIFHAATTNRPELKSIASPTSLASLLKYHQTPFASATQNGFSSLNM